MNILDSIKSVTETFNYDMKLFILILFILAVIDVVTGFTNAWLEGNVSSSKMKKGLLGKLYELLIVLVASILDYLLNVDYITKGTLIFYCIQEITSILENTAQYISYPKVVKDALAQLNSKKEGNK